MNIKIYQEVRQSFGWSRKDYVTNGWSRKGYVFNHVTQLSKRWVLL